jgi:hypothetical protein
MRDATDPVVRSVKFPAVLCERSEPEAPIKRAS